MRRLSGWARLWIVLCGLLWFYIVAKETFGPRPQEASPPGQFDGPPPFDWARLWELSWQVAIFVVVIFLIALAAKSVALWVWHGFRPPPKT